MQGCIKGTIKSLVDDALAVGYEHKDILEWLLSEHELQSEKTYVGSNIPHTSPEDLVQKLLDKYFPEESYGPYTPVKLLLDGDLELFEQLKEDWLGGCDECKK